MTVSLADLQSGPVMVTGASGFLGRAVVADLISAGRATVGLSRNSPEVSGGAEWFRGDLTTGDVTEALQRFRPAAIIHCAGQGGEPRSSEARLHSWQANVDATRHLLEAVAELSEPPRVVVVSSAAIYAPMAADVEAQDEDYPWRPLGFYGAAKASATMLAETFMRRAAAPIVIAVPFNILGPGQPAHQVPQDFINRLRADPGSLSVGDLSAVRDWVDVRDVARALVSLAAPAVPPGVYNIASGRGVAVQRVLEGVIAAMNITPDLEISAAKVGQAGISRSVGNPSKLIEATGWKPKFRLDDSLRDMLTTPDFTNLIVRQK